MERVGGVIEYRCGNKKKIPFCILMCSRSEKRIPFLPNLASGVRVPEAGLEPAQLQ